MSKINQELDKSIKTEAKRIMDILLDIYNKKIKVNKSFHLIVEDITKDEFKPHFLSVLYEVVSIIPLNLYISTNNTKVFITDEELYYKYKKRS